MARELSPTCVFVVGAQKGPSTFPRTTFSTREVDFLRSLVCLLNIHREWCVREPFPSNDSTSAFCTRINIMYRYFRCCWCSVIVNWFNWITHIKSYWIFAPGAYYITYTGSVSIKSILHRWSNLSIGCREVPCRESTASNQTTENILKVKVIFRQCNMNKLQNKLWNKVMLRSKDSPSILIRIGMLCSQQDCHSQFVCYTEKLTIKVGLEHGVWYVTSD